jgi:membrane protein implicated in regulation of membrane protease activity
VREVSDAFLLNMAEVSATLIGLFMVGVFFYIETGFRRLEKGREVFEPYFRAGTRIVLILYALPLGLSLTLVVLSLNWNRVLFALFSLLLVAANVDSFTRVRGVAKVSGSPILLANELLGTAAVVVLVTLPWILGRFHPTREDFTWQFSCRSPRGSSALAPS